MIVIRERWNLLKKNTSYLTKPFIIFSLIFAIGCNNGLYAQEELNNRLKSLSDSLRNAINTASHDTSKISTLLFWGAKIYRNNPDSALFLWDKAQKIADNALVDKIRNFNLESITLMNGQAEALANIGFIHQQNGSLAKAVEYDFKAVNILEDLLFGNLDVAAVTISKNKIREGLCNLYNNIGFIYKTQGEIEKALGYYFLSLKLGEKMKYKEGMAISYNNLGTVYHNQGDNGKALEHYFMSLELREALQDKFAIAESYNNIGAVYRSQGEDDKSLEYCLLSLNISEALKDKKGMAHSYLNIGNMWCKNDSIIQGMKYLRLGLELSKSIDYKAWISICYTSIGNWEMKSENMKDALQNGMLGLKIAKEIDNVEYIKEAAELLSSIYRKKGEWKRALEMHEMYVDMRDSIANAETKKATMRKEFKYETEKNEREIELLTKQKEIQALTINEERSVRRFLVGGSGLILLLLIVVYFAYRNKKRGNKELENAVGKLNKANKELDQFAHIVAHDLKAPLRAVKNMSGFIAEDIRDDTISDETIRKLEIQQSRVSRMEQLIAGILDYSQAGKEQLDAEDVDLYQLVSEIVDSLNPPNNLNVIIQPDMLVIRTERILLSQVISNLISNAFKYNDKPEGTVNIGCEQKEHYCEFFVADDGPGIEAGYQKIIFEMFQTLESKDRNENTGIGLSIVKKIVEEQGGKIWVESALGAGARFCFTWAL